MSRMMMVAVAGSVAALLAGCTSSNASTKTYHASLTATQEVPPTTASGTGTGTFTLDTTTKMLTWSVTYNGLTGPAGAAHIHGPAAPGANAGVEVNLSPSGAPANPITGSTALTDAQIADLEGGKAYVNIHTAANKGGEIRGQITP
jgi:Cu/Zn superoxide dismutase